LYKELKRGALFTVITTVRVDMRNFQKFILIFAEIFRKLKKILATSTFFRSKNSKYLKY